MKSLRQQRMNKKQRDEQPLTQYHAKNYFNSTMGGKDLRLLFAMAVGCNSHELPDHNDPPFSKSKAYHSEVKPDAVEFRRKKRNFE